jgi:hypothetical protein
MATQTHIADLEATHRMLESEIADAVAHPSTDDAKVSELKRRKLHVKDEITRLKQFSSIH